MKNIYTFWSSIFPMQVNVRLHVNLKQSHPLDCWKVNFKRSMEIRFILSIMAYSHLLICDIPAHMPLWALMFPKEMKVMNT